MTKVKEETQSIRGKDVWLLAIRPRTLPAAVAPVIVGTATAMADKGFRCLPALAALAGSLLLTIGVNLANDYFDYIKGVDSSDRLGPVRVTHSGLISPGRVKASMMITFSLAVVVGIYLVSLGGWPILAVGTASIAAALAYSGGPYPLGSHGLGDLLVFLFFGMIAVGGTYYVQTLDYNLLAILTAVPIGLLITAILVVNNLRDIETDRRAGKRTLAVILNKRGAKIEYVCLLAGAYVTPPVLLASGLISIFGLLPILSLPMAFALVRSILYEEGPVLNRRLAGTAQLSLLFSILFSLGLVLS